MQDELSAIKKLWASYLEASDKTLDALADLVKMPDSVKEVLGRREVRATVPWVVLAAFVITDVTVFKAVLRKQD